MAFTLTITGSKPIAPGAPSDADFENQVMTRARDFLTGLSVATTLADAAFVGDATGTTHLLGQIDEV